MTPRLAIDATFEVECSPSALAFSGEIYHVSRNRLGSGSISTPVARFFCWHPTVSEGFNPHWRVDCYVREHALSPEPTWIGKALASLLQRNGYCAEPIWVSWHRSSEVGGESYGEVFERE